jgi:hypothetical protein
MKLLMLRQRLPAEDSNSKKEIYSMLWSEWVTEAILCVGNLLPNIPADDDLFNALIDIRDACIPLDPFLPNSTRYGPQDKRQVINGLTALSARVKEVYPSLSSQHQEAAKAIDGSRNRAMKHLNHFFPKDEIWNRE